MNRFAIACVLGLLASGCSGSVHDVEVAHAHGEGTTRVYNVPRDRAWAISHDVLKSDVDTIEDHADAGYLTAIRKSGFGRYGAVVGVWLAPQGADHTAVTVVTRREDSIVKGMSEDSFHDRFAALAR